MGKAGGIIGIVAGIFGVIAAVITLFVGGVSSAFEAEGAKTIVGLGWGGVFFSFLAIILGAVTLARPRGAGIGLIVVSILGAILGGTLVAICMVLSLIGGILAVSGGKKTIVSPAPGIEATAPSGKKSSAWLWAGGGAASVLVALIAIGSLAPSKPKTDPLAELDTAQASAVQPEGELSELFAMGSKSTDIQRDNKLKELKGQVVLWTLPVYEVGRSGKAYKIQTTASVRFGSFGNELLGTFVYITPRNDDERRRIEALKTDELVSFKGRIAGSTLRHLEIKPAILAAPGVPMTVAPAPARQEVTKAEIPAVSPAKTEPVIALAEASEPVVPSKKASWKPSFDCMKASTFSEKAVCSDPLLGNLDGALAQNYGAMLASNIGDGARKDLRTRQRAWLAERNRCTEAQCLVASYRTRIDEVCDYPVLSGVHPGCTSSDEIE